MVKINDIPLQRATQGGVVSVDALRAIPMRHPADFAKPPASVQFRAGALNLRNTPGRVTAAISLAGRPAE